MSDVIALSLSVTVSLAYYKGYIHNIDSNFALHSIKAMSSGSALILLKGILIHKWPQLAEWDASIAFVTTIGFLSNLLFYLTIFYKGIPELFISPIIILFITAFVYYKGWFFPYFLYDNPYTQEEMKKAKSSFKMLDEEVNEKRNKEIVEIKQRYDDAKVQYYSDNRNDWKRKHFETANKEWDKVKDKWASKKLGQLQEKHKRLKAIVRSFDKFYPKAA